MTSGIEPVPQPRVDMLVTDAATGKQLRQTEYSGTVWFGGRPEITGFGSVSRGGLASIDSPFVLPDSLPYVASRTGDAVVACTVATQSAFAASQIANYRAGLVPDPRGGDLAWLQVQIVAVAQVPLGVSYRVLVQVALDAVATTPPVTMA
jgi:hypothetical protein